MKKILQEWSEERAYVKITQNFFEAESSKPSTFAGFLLNYDEVGVTINLSHTQKKLVLMPWNNILNITLWGENNLR